MVLTGVEAKPLGGTQQVQVDKPKSKILWMKATPTEWYNYISPLKMKAYEW